MPQFTYKAAEKEAYPDLAQKILATCFDVRIFALYGELGAGKTTFIQAFCQVLGVQEPVDSPTYTLMHAYEGTGGPIYHFDFYRLKAQAEADELGCEEYFFSGNYSFIEWPERIPDLLPEEAAHIRMRVLPDQSRHIDLSYGLHGEERTVY